MDKESVPCKHKQCTVCGVSKPATVQNFHKRKSSQDGLHYTCKQCRKAETLAYREANRDALRQKYADNRDRNIKKMAEYREAHREVSREASRRWYQANKELVREASRRRRASDPSYRLRRNISTAIANCLSGKKAGRKWQSLVGYSEIDLRMHLERQFSRGMTWENYGSYWHVDHIVPLSSFDVTRDDLLAAAWALSNLRPLRSVANWSKGDKRLYLL